MEQVIQATQGRNHEEVSNMIVGNYLTFLYGKGELITWLIEGETGIGKTALTRLDYPQEGKRQQVFVQEVQSSGRQGNALPPD